MKQRVIFLDIDGTLCGAKSRVPDSAIEACQRARQKGHLIFLCTGRSKIEIFDEILSIGFDGVIGAAGGYIEVGNEVLLHRTISVEALTELKAYFNEHQIPYIFESNSGLYCEKGTPQVIKSLIGLKEEEANQNRFVNLLVECENPVRKDVNKILFLQSETTVEQITKAVAEKFHIIPCTISDFGENSGEITIRNVHKAKAIELLLQYLEIPKSQTLAFGDGLNDIEMLQYVQIGVAMGNAHDKVKQVADDITDSVFEDGLMKAFKKYYLI